MSVLPSLLLSWKYNLFRAYLSRQVEEEHIVISSSSLGEYLQEVAGLHLQDALAASCRASPLKLLRLSFVLLVNRDHLRADCNEPNSLMWRWKRSFMSHVRASSSKLCRSVKLWRAFSWLSNYWGLNCDTQTWCIPPPTASSLSVLQNLSVPCPSYIYLSSSVPIHCLSPCFHMSLSLTLSCPNCHRTCWWSVSCVHKGLVCFSCRDFHTRSDTPLNSCRDVCFYPPPHIY